MGGSSHSLLNLINSLRGKVYPVIIVPQEGKACQEFRKRGIKYFVVPFHLNITEEKGLSRILTFAPRYIKDLIVNTSAVNQIVDIAKCENIHLIHSNSAVIDFGQNIADSLGVRHIWHLRELMDLYYGLSPVIGWKFFLKKLFQSDVNICVSKSVYKHYKLASHPNSYILYNAVRSENHPDATFKKKNYLLFCGAVTREKGIEDALNAISIIHKRYPQIRLLVIGNLDNSYYSQLYNLMKELRIYHCVEFLGHQANPDDYMQEALALLMCSKNEALGRVTIEAMFNGCPVIGNDSAGTAELIKNYETGYLYSNVNELAEKITYLIEDYNRSANVIERARDFAIENFSEEKYAIKLLSIYEKFS